MIKRIHPLVVLDDFYKLNCFFLNYFSPCCPGRGSFITVKLLSCIVCIVGFRNWQKCILEICNETFARSLLWKADGEWGPPSARGPIGRNRSNRLKTGPWFVALRDQNGSQIFPTVSQNTLYARFTTTPKYTKTLICNYLGNQMKQLRSLTMSSQSARSNLKKTLEGPQYVVSMGYVPTNPSELRGF